ncbi:GIY-YIG nuclease family protein [Mesorhizobium sp.]|uniref:GIY-YIG nuclease family protein n=1 Tax=Mesorhizobium sp. TaxID=1871066 RepID=UPI0025D9EB3C|nr:GIY-YIG nuclease family protein [Mesorhizobium sp.]
MLTREEVSFLQSQGLSSTDVFDTKGRSPRVVRDEARAAGKRILLGVPCQAAGHRLRTRAGHCVQCDPSKIAYQQRTEVPGDVYLAVSSSLGWVKIGSTTNIAQRRYKINFDAYGGASDWKLVFFLRVSDHGRLELAAHAALSRFAVDAPYIKDGRKQVSRECFGCSDLLAVKTIIDCAGRGGHRVETDWRDQNHHWQGQRTKDR